MEIVFSVLLRYRPALLSRLYRYGSYPARRRGALLTHGGCRRQKGSGTVSLGLDRFWVFIRGESAAGDDCRILEMRQVGTSGLAGLVLKPDYGDMNSKKSARQAVKAHRLDFAGCWAPWVISDFNPLAGDFDCGVFQLTGN